MNELAIFVFFIVVIVKIAVFWVLLPLVRYKFYHGTVGESLQKVGCVALTMVHGFGEMWSSIV
jgi:hypothetical protein